MPASRGLTPRRGMWFVGSVSRWLRRIRRMYCSEGRTGSSDGRMASRDERLLRMSDSDSDIVTATHTTRASKKTVPAGGNCA